MENKRKNLSVESFEDVLNELKLQTKTVASLDPNNLAHAKAVYIYLNENPQLIVLMKNGNEIQFLEGYIREDFRRFVLLDQTQYTENLTQFYIEQRLAESKKEAGVEEKEGMTVSHSFDKKLLLHVPYITHAGEEIFYFDPILKVEAQLISNLTFTFKLTNPLQFFQKIDINIEQFGYNAVNTELINCINLIYRRVLINAVSAEGVGIYHLAALYENLTKELIRQVQSYFADAGIILKKVFIHKITMPDTTMNVLQKQSFDIRQEREIKYNEADYERVSLQNYRLKAEIHATYPNFEVGMTEAEKDLALNRYIRKKKGEFEIHPSTTVTERIIERPIATQDNSTRPIYIQTMPQEPKKPDKRIPYRLILFSIGAIIFAVLAIIAVLVTQKIGWALILFGVGIAMMGGIAALFPKIFAEKKEIDEINRKYALLYDRYSQEIEAYHAKFGIAPDAVPPEIVSQETKEQPKHE